MEFFLRVKICLKEMKIASGVYTSLSDFQNGQKILIKTGPGSNPLNKIVGGQIVSGTRGLQFESNRWHFLPILAVLKRQKYRKEARHGPI